MKALRYLVWLLLSSSIHAGVYGELEFGDDREAVTQKLGKSQLVEQTVDNTYTARTGLNGIYKCKTDISGLACRLYFNWDEKGELNEITLRSDSLDADLYKTELKGAWTDAGALFSRVYNKPKQQASYPPLSSFKEHKMMVTHVWGNNNGTSTLMGTGMDENQCFLFIRFLPTQTDLIPQE